MKDTSKDIQEKYHSMLMNKTGEERLKMSAKMEETARKMVISSLPDDLNEDQKKIKIFMRYYKNDFSQQEINEIKKYLKKDQ